MELSAFEKRLFISYLLCAIFGAVASITTGIAWGHWKQTLDHCYYGKNCSCILYGQFTRSIFLGGSNAVCGYITFAPLFYTLFGIAFSCFHGYRVLFHKVQTATRTVRTKNEAGEMVEMHAVQLTGPTNLPRLYWIILSCFTVAWTLYALIHFAIFLDGFYETCNQYRKTLEGLLRISGTAVPVIYRRLSCQAVFDFMDYMQLDSGNSYRDGLIFTGLDLILGIVGAFFAWVVFAFTAFCNIQIARNSA